MKAGYATGRSFLMGLLAQRGVDIALDLMKLRRLQVQPVEGKS